MANFDHIYNLVKKLIFHKQIFFYMPNLALPELLVIGFLFILFFGRDKLGPTFHQLGGAITEFKKGLNEGQNAAEEIKTQVSLSPEKKVEKVEKVQVIENLSPISQ